MMQTGFCMNEGEIESIGNMKNCWFLHLYTEKSMNLTKGVEYETKQLKPKDPKNIYKIVLLL